MQTQCNNISNLIFSDFWFKALFSSYSVICSPWCPLREIQSQAKIKLFTAGCFSTRQSHLGMGQAKTWVKTWKRGCRRLVCVWQHSPNLDIGVAQVYIVLLIFSLLFSLLCQILVLLLGKLLELSLLLLLTLLTLAKVSAEQSYM